MTRLLYLVSAAIMIATHTQAEDVYKWTDKSGTTHYSSQAPSGQSAEIIRVRGNDPILTDQEDRDVETPASEVEDSAPSIKDLKKCDKARQTLRELTAEGDLRTRNPKTGEYERVSDDDLEQWRQWVEADIGQYCP